MIAYYRNSIWCKILLFLAWEIPGYSYQEFPLVPQGRGLISLSYPLGNNIDSKVIMSYAYKYKVQ